MVSKRLRPAYIPSGRDSQPPTPSGLDMDQLMDVLDQSTRTSQPPSPSGHESGSEAQRTPGRQ